MGDGYQNLFVQSFFILIIGFYYCNLREEALRKTFSRYYVFSVWFSTLLALFFYITKYPNPTYGYSGVVYATMGVGVVSPLISIYNRIRELRKNVLSRMAIYFVIPVIPGLFLIGVVGYLALFVIVSLFFFGYYMYGRLHLTQNSLSLRDFLKTSDFFNYYIFSLVLLFALSARNNFFNIGSGVNAYVHVLSFTFALISGVFCVYFFSRRRLNSNVDVGQVQAKPLI